MENTTILRKRLHVRSEAMKISIILLLFLMILPITAGCTVTNKYDSYFGKVIDGETKQPIEGAAVLIIYNTEQYGLAGSVSYFADAQETLTDKNGEFKIPAMRIYKFRVLSGWERYTGVRIFKPGYGCYPKHKYAEPHFDWSSLPPNQYVTIELPRLKTREERLENEGCFPVGVPDDRMKKLIELNNIESVDLGLQPTHIRRK